MFGKRDDLSILILFLVLALMGDFGKRDDMGVLLLFLLLLGFDGKKGRR